MLLIEKKETCVFRNELKKDYELKIKRAKTLNIKNILTCVSYTTLKAMKIYINTILIWLLTFLSSNG